MFSKQNKVFLDHVRHRKVADIDHESDQVPKGRSVDALALRGDEGRDTLRKATGRCEYPLIRGYPNGETRPARAIRH
jgi:hypothetical protein